MINPSTGWIKAILASHLTIVPVEPVASELILLPHFLTLASIFVTSCASFDWSGQDVGQIQSFSAELGNPIHLP